MLRSWPRPVECRCDSHSTGGGHARISQYSKLSERLSKALAPATLVAIGRDAGFVVRQRDLHVPDFVASLLGTFGHGNASCLADLHRAYSRVTGTDMDYRSFYDRLDSDGFPALMKGVFMHAANHFVLQALRFLPGSPFARFSAVLIQDGSSFAVHDGLAEVFPGRFKKNAPAAVELHATFDLLANTCETVSVAPDVQGERDFLPTAACLAGTLLLADRGYPSWAYLAEVDTAGGAFVMRAKTYLAAPVVGFYDAAGALVDVEQPYALHAWLKLHGGQAQDLVVQVTVGDEVKHFRVVTFPKPKVGPTILLTNLPRAGFSAEQVGLAYRLRWQVELLFREYKSHANLQRFVTRKKPIAEGLIWTSLLVSLLTRFLATAAQLVGRVAISTLKVAKVLGAHLTPLLAAFARGGIDFEVAFRDVLADLIQNAKRAHPARDKQSGREQSGLQPVF
jgi:hypothetical protein